MSFDEQNATNIESQQELDLRALQPHEYPRWFNVFAFIIIAALTYSFVRLPKLLKSISLLQAAQTDFSNKCYASAKRNYLLFLKDFPQSKVANLGLAEAIFADKIYGDHLMGLRHLSTIQLNQEQWARITKIMPVEFQDLFTNRTR